MSRRLIVLSLSMIIYRVFAATQITQNSASSPVKFNLSVKPSTSTPLSAEFSNLNNIDTDTNDINQLNRKLQIEKVQAELKKIKGGVSNVANAALHVSDENAQTTVTGVAINQEGRKIAWLQFADGGALTVDIGSQVGKYTVSDISMTGVTLLGVGNTKYKKAKTIYLKRVYAAAGSGRKAVLSNNGANMLFTPSPVLTGANSTNSEIIPPIIKTR